MLHVYDSDRKERAREHALAISALLGRPAVKSVPQRVFRARLWLEVNTGDLISAPEHEYVVMTLVQNTQQSAVKVYVSRPYIYATSLAKLELSGAYSVDEIVAFLTLDRVPIEEVEWSDETGSNLLTAPDMNTLFRE